MPFAYLVLVNVPDDEWSHQLHPGVTVIGRSRNADIRIPSMYDSVSRLHAEFSGQGQNFMIRDLGSSGGTSVNGVWIDNGRSVRVDVGDQLSLAGVKLNLVAEVSQLAQVISNFKGMEQEPDTSILRKDSRSFAREMLKRLTPAELDVMVGLCRGYTTDEELSKMLGRKPNTVRTQVSSILEKLELHSRAAIVSWLDRSNRKPPARSPAPDFKDTAEFDQVKDIPPPPQSQRP